MAQKFHGLSLANNSTADNFHFERLALDPVVTLPGRLWFNTTDKVFKYSGLNGVGAVVINVIGDSTELAAFQTALEAETNARIASIDTIESAVGLETDGTFAPLTTSNFLSSVTSLKDAALALDIVLKATETAVEAEATARADADTAMQTQVDNLILASGDGSAVLKGTLNSGRYNETTSAALVHDIVHNLNTGYYTVDIKVKGLDNIYRNDIVPIEELDLNSFRVTLTEPSIIKVSVMSTAVLA